MGASCTKTNEGTKYTVQVKTGDRFGMGTDAQISLAFYNEHGVRTRDYKLDNIFKNDFEYGHTDSFDIAIEDVAFGDPVQIELQRDSAGLADAWFCEFVRVVNVKGNKVHMFPVHRWLPAGNPMKLREYDTVLSQDDVNGTQRREELQKKRDIYVPILNDKTGMIMLKDLPTDENFSITAGLNIKMTSKRLLAESKLVGFNMDKWDSLKDLEEIYKEPHFPVPMGVERWKSDKEFGNQRLSGCNPAMIRLCTKIPDNFGVNEEDIQPLLEGMTITEAIDNKRLFIIDHKILKDLPCTDGREICAPIALFFVNKDQYLMPVAIQLYQDLAPDNPVFYPSDPEYTWLMAKCYFNLADFSVHEAASHLGFTHLIGEVIVIATQRSLSPSHPIFRLLAPHFLYLLAINNKALSPLLGEGGFMDDNVSVGHVGVAEIIKRTFATWRLDVEGSLHADLLERGVSDPEVLPNYHYRDDALILRKAICNYVGEVVEHHYDDPAKIASDEELQEWGRFMGGKPNEGEITGCIKGVPNDGQFKTTAEITTIVTDIIFIFSAVHAAVNFGQYDNYGYPPACPGWMNGRPPQNKSELSEQDIILQLPNKQRTLQIMVLTKLLSSRDTNSLGDFEMQYIYDPVGVEALKRFRAELKEVGATIDKRNETREEKYFWLHPKEVPNSIAI